MNKIISILIHQHHCSLLFTCVPATLCLVDEIYSAIAEVTLVRRVPNFLITILEISSKALLLDDQHGRNVGNGWHSSMLIEI